MQRCPLRRCRQRGPYGAFAYSHSDYSFPEPPPPLVLRARCVPLPENAAAKQNVPGATLEHLMQSLEADRLRLSDAGHLPGPFKPETVTELTQY